MMGPRDWAAIANAISFGADIERATGADVAALIAHTIVHHLERDNPKFDRNAFLRDCGAIP